MGLYERLVRLNKGKPRDNKVRIDLDEKTNNYFIIYLKDKSYIKLKNMNMLFNLPCYIENISILKGSKISNTCYIDSKDWNKIEGILGMFYWNNFSIERVDDLEFYLPKAPLMGYRIMYNNGLFALIRNNYDVKLIADAKLIIDNDTCLNFKSLHIKRIYLSNLDLSRVTSLQNMFLYCIQTEEIYFKDIDISKVKIFKKMFGDCWALKRVNIGDLTVDNPSDLSYMFGGCEKLETLNLKNFNVTIQNNDIIEGMFYNCAELKNLDISNFLLDGNFLFIDDDFAYGKLPSSHVYLRNIFVGCDSLDKSSVKLKQKCNNSVKTVKLEDLCVFEKTKLS